MSSFNWPPQGSGSGSGVSSVNTLTGAVVLVAGSGVTITPSGQNLTIAATGSGSGSVTTVSVASANGFSGSVATATTTPIITISTSITGILKGNGTAISAATSGTDYAPGTSANATGLVKSTTSTGALTTAVAGTDYTAGTAALGTGILKSTTSTGAITIAVAADFPTLNQNTTGTAANITATTNSTLTTISTLVSVGTITTGVWSGTAIAIAKGGTGQTTVITAPAATTYAGWDANKNFSANNLLGGFATTATAAATTTLVVGSAYQQVFTGTTTQTVALPVVTTLVNGTQFQIVNLSTGVVTVNTSGAVTTQAMAANTFLNLTCINTAGGTGTASWAWIYGNVDGALPGSLPLTTKGDMLTYSTVPTRHAVPGDYGQLIADSAQTDGWRSENYLQTNGRPGKNYIQYADFENGTTTGWTLGTTGTLTNAIPTGTPTFGSGAAGALSFAAITTGQLAGTTSGSLISSAATTAGNMLASSAYTIDPEDQAKVLSYKFYYQPASGITNCNFSGTSSNSFAVAIWDVTNSVWLGLAGNFNLVQNSGVGIATGTFQTNSNTASIRLVVYCANATAGAATINFDDFFVGPQISPQAPAIYDAVPSIAVSPNASGFGTVTSPSYFQKRVGDYAEITMGWINGTVAASTAFITLSGISIDSTKLPSNSTGTVVGYGTILPSATGRDIFSANDAIYVFYDGSTTNSIFITNVDGATSLTKQNVNAFTGNSQGVTITFRLPIAGWSSNSVASSDTDTRVIEAIFKGAAGSPSALNPIIFPTVVNDTASGYNSTTGQYKVAVTGFYTGSILLNVSTLSASNIIYIYKNGSNAASIGITGNQVGVGSGDVFAIAGDLLDFRCSGNMTTVSADSQGSFSRKSGPAVITATESVNGRYFASSTTISGSLATVLYATKGWDSHGAYNNSNGIWTAPVSGKYLFNSAIATAGTIALNNALDMQIQQTGSSSQISESLVDAAGAVSNLGTSVTDEFYCLAGDTIKVQVSSGAITPSIVSSNSRNYFSWSRIGN